MPAHFDDKQEKYQEKKYSKVDSSYLDMLCKFQDHNKNQTLVKVQLIHYVNNSTKMRTLKEYSHKVTRVQNNKIYFEYNISAKEDEHVFKST